MTYIKKSSVNDPKQRRRWSKKDDELLRFYYKKYNGSWSKIARHFPGRDNRACYDRWHNHAKPNINKKPLEKWEKEKLKENHKRYGNKWTLVAEGLEGRTPLQAKNFFNAGKKTSSMKSGKRNSVRSPLQAKNIFNAEERKSSARIKKQMALARIMN
ncbi:6926_t:CDS:2 [Paraglomus brasilianum]|uniref:6926_t:CDS:1 n=1 Tax=Paraglomus brasilianum TaxID=144538 RepID=A0A9N9CHN9_9GLOM|nr:6926_t:CDS:2 [Paraglomus brasilianum]